MTAEGLPVAGMGRGAENPIAIDRSRRNQTGRTVSRHDARQPLSAPVRDVLKRTGFPHTVILRGKVDKNTANCLQEIWNELRAYALRMLQDSNAAEDVLQETALALCSPPSSAKIDQTRMRGWIWAIHRNKVMDHLRMTCQRRVSTWDSSAWEGDLVSPGEEIPAKLVREELRSTLDRLMDDLRPRDRRVFLARYAEGQTFQEIAIGESVTGEAVRQRIGNTLGVLARGLKRVYGSSLS